MKRGKRWGTSRGWVRKIPIHYTVNGVRGPFDVKLARTKSFGVQRNQFNNLVLKIALTHADVEVIESVRNAAIEHLKKTEIANFVFDGAIKNPVYGESSKRMDPQLNEDKENKKVYTRFYDVEHKWKLPLRDVEEKKFDARAVVSFMSVWLKNDGTASLTIRAKKVFVWWNELDSEDEYTEKPEEENPDSSKKRKKRTKKSKKSKKAKVSEDLETSSSEEE